MKYDSTKDILEHKILVKNNILAIITELLDRAETHDISKLGDYEKPIFDEYTQKLKELEYWSEEYQENLKNMKKALEHHYSQNSHHPEHYSNGIKGMNIIDLVEMIADWNAATQRNKDGDIHKSIENNQARFNYSDDLKSIMHNTADWLLCK